jgi:hypothetical protein
MAGWGIYTRRAPVGERYGLWTVAGFAGARGSYPVWWVSCACCGTRRAVSASALRSGSARFHECLRRHPVLDYDLMPDE